MTPAALMLAGSAMAPEEPVALVGAAAEPAALVGAAAEAAALVAAATALVAAAAALVAAALDEPLAPDELELPQALVSASAPTARVVPTRRADRVTILNVTSSTGDGSVRRRDPPEYGPPQTL